MNNQSIEKKMILRVRVTSRDVLFDPIIIQCEICNNENYFSFVVIMIRLELN